MIIWTRFFEIHDYHVFKQESLWKWENMCSCFPWIIYDARYPWLRADTSFSHDPIVHGERYTWTIFRKIKRSLGVVTPRVARATIHLSFFFIVRPAVAFQIPRIRNPPYCERGNFLECYSFCVRMKEREREREILRRLWCCFHWPWAIERRGVHSTLAMVLPRNNVKEDLYVKFVSTDDDD